MAALAALIENELFPVWAKPDFMVASAGADEARPLFLRKLRGGAVKIGGHLSGVAQRQRLRKFDGEWAAISMIVAYQFWGDVADFLDQRVARGGFKPKPVQIALHNQEDMGLFVPTDADFEVHGSTSHPGTELAPTLGRLSLDLGVNKS
ncbi:MAG: hypothetical protein NVV62_11180 [Terricaulis sp.]|nr:hypothetical protein [Terricaulis sp.]